MIDQLQIGFVHKRRCVERVPIPFTSQLRVRHSPQPIVDQWQEPVQRIATSDADIVQESREFVCVHGKGNKSYQWSRESPRRGRSASAWP